MKIKKIDSETFEFTTSKIERYTLEQLQRNVQMCDDMLVNHGREKMMMNKIIADQEIEKVMWEAKIAAAEAI